QAFAILPKILEVNELLRADTTLQDKVREIHPEVCFAAWNGGRAMQHRKSELAGETERGRLIDRIWPDGRARFVRKLGRYGYQIDDLTDAFAALWTATRIASGAAKVIGSQTPDQFGLRMQMWA